VLLPYMYIGIWPPAWNMNHLHLLHAPVYQHRSHYNILSFNSSAGCGEECFD